MQKSILITGCSSGIGYDAAHTLNKRGWRVFATCRKEVDCERLRGEGLESFILDYEDEATMITALAEVLERTGGTLDALFNNGAYAIPGLAQDIPRDGMRAIFEANFFGYWDMTNRVIPIMAKQGHGRIVQCSSVLGFAALPGRASYNSTKFALEGMTDTMRMELRNQPIDLILIEPGPITTKIRQNAQKPFEKWVNWEGSMGRKLYKNSLIPRLYAEGGDLDFGELGPEAVTQKLIHALESKRPKARYFVTKPTYIAAFLKWALPTRTTDWLFSRS